MERLKRRYTDQEVYNLLCILEAEKKCVQNLRYRLQQLESKAADLKRLQHLVDHYKQMAEEKESLDSTYHENEQLSQKLDEKTEQLEIALADLSANSDYIGTLQRELKEVKTAKSKLQERVARLEENHEAIEVALIEAEKREADGKENGQRIRAELAAEKEAALQLCESLEKKEERARLALEVLQGENREKESLLAETRERVTELESSLHTLAGVKAAEKAEFLTRFSDGQATLQALAEEVDTYKKELVQALEQLQVLKEANEQNAHQERIALQGEMNALRENVAALRAKEEMQEQTVRTAQTHLARKIKEMAEQKTLVEERGQELRELRLKSDQMQMRLGEVHRELENKERETTRLQGEMQSATRALESERRERQEQFAAVIAKMKEQESEIERLKTIETRFSQLGNAFKGLNALIESQPTTPAEKPLPPPPPPALPPPPPLPQDLFQNNSPTRKFRDSLFDE